MKKTKLTRSLLAACSIVALSAVMYGCVHNGGDDAPATDMSVTPDPVPEPIEPAGPTDLEDTQAEADAAATAAMTASTNAATSASSAAAATMTLATLQTGADSNSDAMGGREAAYAAHAAAGEAAAEAAKAATASAAAAAAATGSEAEAALRMALDAQDAAEAAEATADTMAKAAIAAAMTELHIAGTVKSVGESSVDATTGTLISPDKKMNTGLQNPVARPTSASEGQAFDQRGDDMGIETDATDNAADVAYKQAVAAGSINIGKVLDTSDDKSRLTIITSYQGKKTVRVFVDGNGEAANATLGTMLKDTAVLGLEGFALTDFDDDTVGIQGATVKSIGMYYTANHRVTTGDDADTLPTTGIVGTAATHPETLDAYDRVDLTDGGNPEEIFELTATIGEGAAAVEVTHHARVVETITDDQGVTTKHYKPVDIMANASMTDGGDNDGAPDDLRPVTVSIPAATEYSHIHFGLWANLDAKGSAIANLGIGFVQNYDGSGMTERQGIGSATFNGDWVAAVRRKYASDAEAGAINMDSGSATLTADFEDGEFTGVLAGLATLEGTLSGNGFSGIKATASHDDLDSDGTFAGEFSGGIYGPTGSEAAGVFDFDGDEAGAFRGAFGGTQ